MKCARRKAIVGAIVGADVVGVGWWFAQERDRLVRRTLLHIKPGEAGLNGWVKIARDDSVIVAVPRAEMGQGTIPPWPCGSPKKWRRVGTRCGSRIRRTTGSIAISVS